MDISSLGPQTGTARSEYFYETSHIMEHPQSLIYIGLIFTGRGGASNQPEYENDS